MGLRVYGFFKLTVFTKVEPLVIVTETDCFNVHSETLFESHHLHLKRWGVDSEKGLISLDSNAQTPPNFYVLWCENRTNGKYTCVFDKAFEPKVSQAMQNILSITTKKSSSPINSLIFEAGKYLSN